MRSVRLLLFVAQLVSLGSMAAAQASRPHPSVCRVVVQERDGVAFGSGTLIDARGQYGLVVTNWHVVSDASGSIETVFPGGFRSEARPLKLDQTWDLAALVVWRPPTEPVSLAARPPQPGDPLTICGYGQGDYRAAAGRCTDYYAPEIGMPQELVELNVEARQGDSGGPIFNDRGELAGVLFGAGQGTTLGSFGGRVHSFLATLAPDIGRPERPAVIAARQPLPAETAPSNQELIASKPVAGESAWPATLADRTSAPRRAASKQADPWPAVGAEASDQWESSRLSSARTASLPPQPTIVSDPPAEIPIDWWEDGRTLLALVGIASIVIHGVRAMSG